MFFLHIDKIWKNLPMFRLKDKFGNYFVSNKDCTNDTEIVLDQGEEVENIYIEKIKKIRYHQSRKPKPVKATPPPAPPKPPAPAINIIQQPSNPYSSAFNW